MRLKGEVIGEWINGVIVPGLTSDGRPPLKMIAFSGKEQRPHDHGRTGTQAEDRHREGRGLPGWSDDGKKLAYLEQKDQKKFVLNVVDISVES